MFQPMGGLAPNDAAMVQADLQGELNAIDQYTAHMQMTLNPALQRLWARIRQDEVRHAHWLRMAPATATAEPFPTGQVVVPTVAHMPEHRNRAARVVDEASRSNSPTTERDKPRRPPKTRWPPFHI